jgi:hypothetical protein
MGAEPAFIVLRFSDPLEVDCGPPMSGAYLCSCMSQRISHFVQTGLLRRGRRDLLSPVVVRGIVPGQFCFPKLFGDPKFQVCNRHDAGVAPLSRLPFQLSHRPSRCLGCLRAL